MRKILRRIGAHNKTLHSQRPLPPALGRRTAAIAYATTRFAAR
jgi:hypothetical protein